ncbi:MAG: CDP-alcohol phosphatidyltransferase family protein, partial [Desulfobacterales bacterium]
MRIPKSLGMYWWTTALISFCAVIVFNLLLSFHWLIPFDWTRFVVPLLPLIYVLAVLRSGLPLNHRPGETQVLAHLGMANGITMVRGVLVSVLACFWNWPATIPFSIHHSYAWLPGVIYIAAALLDLVDGMVARHTDRVTRLGERLDTLFDALGLLTAVLAGIALNQLPLSYLAVALAYYVFSAGIRIRRRVGRMVIPLESRPAARLIAGFNMGFVGTALLPIYRPPATTIAAMVFMVPFLAGFLRDWLVVSGRIKTGASQPAPWEEKWQCLFRQGLPVILRAVLLLSSLAALEKTAAFFSGNAEGPFYIFGSIVRPIFLLSIVLVSIGVMGRLAALPILLLSGLWISRQGSDPLWCLLMVAAAGLLITGSGNLSLWQPEEKYLGMS